VAIDGGLDSDIFVLESAMGKDLILDFEDGTDFFTLGSNLEFADLNIVDLAGGVTIEYAADRMAIAFVSNVSAADITEQDFTTL